MFPLSTLEVPDSPDSPDAVHSLCHSVSLLSPSIEVIKLCNKKTTPYPNDSSQVLIVQAHLDT